MYNLCECILNVYRYSIKCSEMIVHIRVDKNQTGLESVESNNKSKLPNPV